MTDDPQDNARAADDLSVTIKCTRGVRAVRPDDFDAVDRVIQRQTKQAADTARAWGDGWFAIWTDFFNALRGK